MHGSIRRVTAVINGDVPDRAPLFDLLRNDAVIEHFAGKRLTFENAADVVYSAYAPAIDATRPVVGIPNRELTRLLEDGRELRQYRWTSWILPRTYADSASYAAHKRAELGASDPAAWSAALQADLDRSLRRIDTEKDKLGEVFFMPDLAGPALMGIYGEVGVEAFCYFLADCSAIVPALLERNTVAAITAAQHYPDDHGLVAGFLGDDIALKSGPLLSPAWLRTHYFPRLARVIAAWHAKGIRILFHSDGNLDTILDDLVEAGVDGLNPIEILAGMDVAQIHRRYPHLFMAGGIDVSQLLPFGSTAAVRDAVRRALDAAGGRIMIGSSTELGDAVPLANFLALRDTVLASPY